MKILFMGTPEFAVPSLRALADADHEILEVWTQPDRPAGRGQRPREPAIKTFARERGIRVEQPESLRGEGVVERLRSLAPDVIVVVAFGRILPARILEVPLRGAINVHGSLLPRYRGAAPIQRALLAGETRTGVSIIQMNERMDAGDVLLQRELEIREDETAGELFLRVAGLGAQALATTLEGLDSGSITPMPQNEADVSFAPMIRKEEAEIDWSDDATTIANRVRAFNPWPGARTRLGGRLLKIHRAAVVRQEASRPAGTIVSANETLEVATGRDHLRLDEVQLEGKRALPARPFLAGEHVREGDRLGC